MPKNKNPKTSDEIPVADDQLDTAKTTPPPADTVTTPDVSTPGAAPKIVRAGAAKPKQKIPLWVWIVGGGVIIIIVAVAGYFWWPHSTKVTVTNTTVVNQNTNASLPLAPRVIDGVMVPATQTNPNLFAVMIENSTDARPQSGLDKASVVYEALAEGGITRFLAIFTQGTSVPEIGPVRSARPYFLDWASEYNKPLYVHAGGSPQALDILRKGTVTVYDYNEFTHGAEFWRDNLRRAPHNLYTSSDKLTQGFTADAPTATATYTGWLFADDPAIDARPDVVKDITINYSSYGYNVSYAYDRALNVYTRTNGGQLHVTRDNTQLRAKNVIVQFVQTSLYPKEKVRLQMQTVGTGKALIFRNGETIVGTWKKAVTENRTTFSDAAGQPVTLTRGNTWVEVVPTDRSVTY